MSRAAEEPCSSAGSPPSPIPDPCLRLCSSCKVTAGRRCPGPAPGPRAVHTKFLFSLKIDGPLSRKEGRGDYEGFATFHYIEGKLRSTSANVVAGDICICEIVCW